MRRSKATVELFDEIRREYEFGAGTIAGAARKYGVHRRMVREAVASAVPRVSTGPERLRPKIDVVAEFIDGILEADRRAPRKQRHTAHRIYSRLTRERPEHQIGESTVRRYVRKRKRELGLLERQTFVPQHHQHGVEAQVDWYEAIAEIGGERTSVHVFTMRSMASGGAYHHAYARPTQQAFLEGHELAFRYFGGTFRRMRYDNLSSAVRKVLRGKQREETERFHAFRSHWQYEAAFCTPGQEGAHEKGGVEGEVGRFRRNHLVPVPRVATLAELNEHLMAGCRENEQRTIAGRIETVGAAMRAEHGTLLPLATEPFDLAEVSFPTVNGMGMVRVRRNGYSVPLPASTVVQVRVLSSVVQVWHQGRCIAEHERSYGRHEEVLDLEHYLDVLEHRPGALAGSKPLEQYRRLGLWPDSYDRFWEGLMRRRGPQNGTKEMIRLLQLGKRFGRPRLQSAIEGALAAGCGDGAAVEHLISAQHLSHDRPEPLAPTRMLPCYDRATPEMHGYDQLMSGVGQ